ncbi:winged helix-turn-helix transcriptional regulator [Humitalea sp. 24SJ18S-53]|uniref:winged helix-turn-helix transcriptional regulator n=1 Tax=Humitalea sp. 24SJ18S-53 TaxID=3422307 RepID=UPI003D679FFF
MTSYGQFCPVAKTCELFAERWTPLILRELCCGPAQFNDLRRRLPLISKTLLAQRLRDLEQHGVISITEKPTGPGHVYALTAAGEDFRPIIDALSLWGQRHTRNILQPEDFDPVFFLMSVRGQIPTSACPVDRFVICFAFRGLPGAKTASKHWWFVITHPDIELCMKNPGYPVDVEISAELPTFTRAWMGYVGLVDEPARRMIAFEGEPAAVERAKGLLGLSDRPRERRLIYGTPDMVDAHRA